MVGISLLPSVPVFELRRGDDEIRHRQARRTCGLNLLLGCLNVLGRCSAVHCYHADGNKA